MMVGQVEPAPRLLAIRKQICSDCMSTQGSGSACASSGQEKVADEPRGRVCDQCLCRLLLNAIGKVVEASDVPDWLEQPNPDLEGRCPRECIVTGRYEPVFEALWLLDPEVEVS